MVKLQGEGYGALEKLLTAIVPLSCDTTSSVYTCAQVGNRMSVPCASVCVGKVGVGSVIAGGCSAVSRGLCCDCGQCELE